MDTYFTPFFLYLKCNCLKQYHIIYCCESSSCSVMSDSWQPHDCSLPGSSVHGILQARIPERLAILFSWGSSWPRDRTRVSYIAGTFFTVWATREAQLLLGQQHMACNIFVVAATKQVVWSKVVLGKETNLDGVKSIQTYAKYQKSWQRGWI